SGVTIIALGGILLPALLAERYPERFTLGLLTASGSLGLLFPPCLPVILYAVVAGVAGGQMFLGGLAPGVLLVTIVAAWAVRGGKRAGTRRTPFSLGELGAAAWEAKWDLLLPVIVLLGIFGGFATMVEAASITVLYAFCVEVFVHRDIDLRSQLPEAGAAAGGGGAGAPSTPPLAAAFDLHPVHLGIILLANPELGFLMPPVGMNLFLSAYRFDRSLGEVTRSVIPFLLILLLGVLAITYVPALYTILLPG